MLQPRAVPTPDGARAAVVIDLIGDLDEILGDIFAETLASLAANRDSTIVVNFRHVSLVDDGALGAVSRAIVESRLGGCTVAIARPNRRIRSLLASARVDCERAFPVPRLGRERHVMIARHANA